MTIQPLSSIRVIEFTHAVLGPACGLILAELGAEVIRVEPPSGDPTRDLRGFGTGYYPFFNRNKKSIAVDIKTEAGRQVIFRLLKRTDVLIENFAPATMERLGLGYAALSAAFPRLIYCSLKGFFPGPYVNRLALDEVVQMMSGLAYMTGPSGKPLRAGASVIDIATGMMGAVGILAALRERDQTGKGQLVRSALFETAAFIMGHHMAYASLSWQPVPPMPERISAWAIYHIFTTAEGDQVFIGVTSDKQWVRFCTAFERPEWLADERLSTNNGRIAQRDWLLPAIQTMIARYSKADVIERCEYADIPFSPVVRPEDLFTDPQLVEGGSLLPVILPNGKQTYLPRLPLLLDGTGAELKHHPPRPGEHTRAILTEMGLESEEIEQLIISGVITAE